MEKTSQSHIIRATHGMMRSLGRIAGVSCGFTKNTGRFIRTSSKMLARLSKTVKQSGKKIAGFKVRRAVPASGLNSY